MLCCAVLCCAVLCYATLGLKPMRPAPAGAPAARCDPKVALLSCELIGLTLKLNTAVTSLDLRGSIA